MGLSLIHIYTKLYGYLDSRGKFTTEWIAHNNSKNNARYVNPQTGAVYKNMTKTIDGVNYRFDKYGNRVNDRTSEFKRSNYYLEMCIRDRPEGSRRRTGVFYYAVRRTAVEKP